MVRKTGQIIRRGPETWMVRIYVGRDPGITEQTYYRWRKEFGGLQVDQARRLKELEQENAKLKRLVSVR
jgi:hypothetical protein